MFIRIKSRTLKSGLKSCYFYLCGSARMGSAVSQTTFAYIGGVRENDGHEKLKLFWNKAIEKLEPFTDNSKPHVNYYLIEIEEKGVPIVMGDMALIDDYEEYEKMRSWTLE